MAAGRKKALFRNLLLGGASPKVRGMEQCRYTFASTLRVLGAHAESVDICTGLKVKKAQNA